MESLLILIVSLLPVVVLFWYIYKKDSMQSEPFSQLFKALSLGVWSAVLAATLEYVLLEIGVVPDTENLTSLVDSFSAAFFLAAIPEELMKFLMFWVVVNNNRHFDEHIDGIVYSSCVALGFAGIENVCYLFGNMDSWMTVGIVRALMAVPMHWGCGILMGYYFSLYHFGLKTDFKTKAMVLVAPILVHGIYDGLLFSVTVEPLLIFVVFVAMIYFLVKFHKKCNEKIKLLKEEDKKATLARLYMTTEVEELATATDDNQSTEI